MQIMAFNYGHLGYKIIAVGYRIAGKFGEGFDLVNLREITKLKPPQMHYCTMHIHSSRKICQNVLVICQN